MLDGVGIGRAAGQERDSAIGEQQREGRREQPPHLERAQAGLVEDLRQVGARVATLVVEQLVMGSEEPRVRGHGQQDAAAGGKELAGLGQGSDVLRDVFEDVEHGHQVVAWAQVIRECSGIGLDDVSGMGVVPQGFDGVRAAVDGGHLAMASEDGEVRTGAGSQVEDA